MLRRTLYEAVFGVIGMALAGLGDALLFIPPFTEVGDALLGAGCGLLLSLLIALVSRPRLKVMVKPGVYDSTLGTKWVHLAVRNTSSGFLGRGEANACTATLTFDDRDREFHPKWETRRDPIRADVMATPAGISVVPRVDEGLVDEIRVEGMPPDERVKPKLLEVAYKFPGDPNCYISEPGQWKQAGPQGVIIEPGPERAFGEGKHAFTVELHDRGTLVATKRFVLVNEPGTGPEGLRIEKEK